MTERISTMYRILMESGDPRANRYPLVQSPVASLIFLVLYVIFVKTAPRYFRHRKPVYLKPILVPYNIAMVLFSVYMCKEFFMCAYLGNFNLLCEPINTSMDPLPMRLINVFWWFYMSKIIEALDTIFMVMSKKESQLTFLHTFHHGTMVFNQWLATKYFPGGHGFAHGFLNSFVHIIMYSYYGLACFPAMKKFLWWKKYLTVLQLVQFILIITHVCSGLINGCLNPAWPSIHMSLYCVILFVLFSNFFIHAYFNKRASTKAAYALNGSVKNGDLKNGSVKNGDLKNGSMKNGDLKNGSAKNGDLKNGSLKNGDLKNGTLKNGDVQNGDAKHHKKEA